MTISSHGLFSSLSIRNYRLYWFGAVLKNNGRWAQYVATYYIIFRLTESASWVGLTAFANFVPMLVVNPINRVALRQHEPSKCFNSHECNRFFHGGNEWLLLGSGAKRTGCMGFHFFLLNGAVSGLLIP